MCDVQKYFDMYDDIMKLTPEDTLQLMLEAKSKDEKDFFAVLGNFLLQKRQKQAIERNAF